MMKKKTESKKKIRFKSKINRFFIFKRFSKWRRYIWIKQNVEMENQLDRIDLIYKTGNKKKDETNDFKSLKRYLLEEKFITMIYD